MDVPEPAARPARERDAHLEVLSSFDFDPPAGKPSNRVPKEFGIATRAKNPRCSTLAYVPELNTFYCAREDGCVVQWRSRLFHDDEVVHVTQSRPAFPTHGHTGVVLCLLALKPIPGRFTHGTLITGGADSSVKVWDPRKLDAHNAVLQSLKGHTGSVLCLEQCVDTVVSGCRMGEVRLWSLVDFKNSKEDDENFEVKRVAERAPIGVTYALFQPTRVLYSSPENLWITGLSFGQTTSVGDYGKLFIALSNGSIQKIKGSRTRVEDSDDDFDDSKSISSMSEASFKSYGSSKTENTAVTSGFSQFMNARAPPTVKFDADVTADSFFSPSTNAYFDLEYGAIDVASKISLLSYYTLEKLVLVLGSDCSARLISSVTGVTLCTFEDMDGARFVDGLISRNDPAGERVLYLADDRGTLRVYDIFDTTGVDPHTEPSCQIHLTGFVTGNNMDDELNCGDPVPAGGVALVKEADVVAVLSQFGRVTGARVTRDTHFELVEGGAAHDARVTVITVGVGLIGENKDNTSTTQNTTTVNSRTTKSLILDENNVEEDLVFTASTDGTLKQRDPFGLASIRRYDMRELEDEYVSDRCVGKVSDNIDITSGFITANNFLVTGHDDGSVRVWDALSGKCVRSFENAHTNSVSSICELSDGSPDGSTDDSDSVEKVLLTGGFDGVLCRWRLRGVEKPPELKKSWRAHFCENEKCEVLTVESFAAAQHVAVSSGNDCRIKFWCGANVLLTEFKPHTEPTTTFSSLGSKLITGAEDGLVKVWDCENISAAAKNSSRTNITSHVSIAPALLMTLDPDSGPLIGVHALSQPQHDNAHLITCSQRGVCVWNYGITGASEQPVRETVTEPAATGETLPTRKSVEEGTRTTDATIVPDATALDENEQMESLTVSLETPPIAIDETNQIEITREDLVENISENTIPRRARRVSQNHRLLSKFSRDDLFSCFAVRERISQILVGTSSGNVIALDVYPKK